jgi:hypothetical protein
VLPTRTAALLAAITLPVLLAAPAAAADQPDGPCEDGGVTVVVDSTALGGEVLMGCATEDPASGTEALQQAGFTDTRDDSGLICAIDALPDPCPTEFTGEYWSYWYGDGEWQNYMEGSDTAAPADGAVEGWRWGDGSTPPAVDLASLPGASAPEGSETEAAAETVTDAADDAAETTADVEEADSSGTSVWWWVIGGVAFVAVVTGIVVFARRSDG